MSIDSSKSSPFWQRTYVTLSLTLAVLFAMVGLIFLFIPQQVLHLFNTISPHWGLMASPELGRNFYLILAVAYMYLVTVLAWMMYRHPENRTFPWLLIQGKSASSLVSIFFFLDAPYLIYLANAIVDGSIAIGVLFLSQKVQQDKL